MGAQMETELIALLGGVTAAAAGVALVIERRMDVLYGPFIEGRANFQTPEKNLLELASCFVDHVRWKMRNMMYLTSILAR